MSLRFPKRLRLVVGGLAVLAVALSLAGVYLARPAHSAISASGGAHEAVLLDASTALH